MDLSSAAALTAIASLIAATIGAIAAVTVACINRASARQIAIDDAHREYRREWARSTIQASRHHFGVLQAMAIPLTTTTSTRVSNWPGKNGGRVL